MAVRSRTLKGAVMPLGVAVAVCFGFITLEGAAERVCD
jgi:hypothetical protein